jgi:predicted regulator of Ras-like GTPase activity (Roadblock/LC7/MglB family)
MKTPAPADLQRWSEDVARDAASLSFLPLARAYRRQGRRDAALRICLRGLERNPDHVEAHSLLAVLYFESGHRVKAYDEWSVVLKIEPDNFDALRGMGFYYLEQEHYEAAKRHLERAAAQKPTDPAVQEGLRIVNERLGVIAPEPALPFELVEEPWIDRQPRIHASTAASPAPVRVGNVTAEPAARFEFAHAPAAAPPRSDEVETDDPSRIFDPLLRGGQVLGALILDQHGLVIGGSLAGSVGARAESLGAILGGAIEEALRTAMHLSLGRWQGVLLEADEAVLHFAPLSEDMIVLLAARKNAPTGWVLRSAAQAAAIARKFLETHL